MKHYLLLLLCVCLSPQVESWLLRKSSQASKMAVRHEALLFAKGRAGHHQSQRLSAKAEDLLKVVHKTAYWGQLSLGTPPQPFKVIFDTGSGNLIIPASDCSVPGCAPHKKYNPKASSSSAGVINEKNEGSSEITFGTGQIEGNFYKDKLCIGDSLCLDASFIAADKMTTEPFQEIPFDGIMGLGFKDLSMGNGFNIVDDLNTKGAIPGSDGCSQFSFFVSDGDDSEVTFGGYRPERLVSDILWAPVKVQSWWQVAIDDITFNNKPKNLCDGQCQVAVDTGTSMLAGPSDLVDKLNSMVNAKEDCSNFDSLPKLGFQIGGTVLNLRPDDYMDRSASGCSFSLMALDVPPPKGPVFIFGDPFLRRFVTIYDRSKPAVGFAVAKHDGTPDDVARQAIAKVQATGLSEAEQAPAGRSNPFAVNLHLDAGLMGGGGGGGDSDSSSSDSDNAAPATTAVTTVAPDVSTQATDSPAAPIAAAVTETSKVSTQDYSDLFNSDASTPASSLPAQSADSVAVPSKPKHEDSAIAMMRAILHGGSFLQTPSSHQGKLVSVKLYRDDK